MSDGAKSYEPVLVMVSVAPFELYQNLYESGPASTWISDITPDVIVETWSGLPLTKFQRSVADVREMLRFPLASPDKVGTVDGASLAMKVYGKTVNYAVGNSVVSNSKHRELTRKLVSKILTTTSQVVGFYERTMVSWWKNQRSAPLIKKEKQHLWVQTPATISNSVQIEKALLKYLVNGPKISGVLIVSSSAYVEKARLRAWVVGHLQGEVIISGGSNEHVSGLAPFFSGFCQYFSWEAIKVLANAKNLDHSLPNDEALTRWLVEHGLNWQSMRIGWSTTELDNGVCPMCDDEDMIVVRCTSHGSRWREAQYMRQLHHEHSSR